MAGDCFGVVIDRKLDENSVMVLVGGHFAFAMRAWRRMVVEML